MARWGHKLHHLSVQELRWPPGRASALCNGARLKERSVQQNEAASRSQPVEESLRRGPVHIPLDVVMCLCRLIHKTARQPPPAKPHIRGRVKDPQGRLSRAILMLEPRAAWTAGVAHNPPLDRQASWHQCLTECQHVEPLVSTGRAQRLKKEEENN